MGFQFSTSEKVCGKQLDRIRRAANLVWTRGDYRYQLVDAIATAFGINHRTTSPMIRLLDHKSENIQYINGRVRNITQHLNVNVCDGVIQIRFKSLSSNIINSFVNWFMSSAMTYVYDCTVNSDNVITIGLSYYGDNYIMTRVAGKYTDQKLVNEIKCVMGPDYVESDRKFNSLCGWQEHKPMNKSDDSVETKDPALEITKQLDDLYRKIRHHNDVILEYKKEVRSLLSDLSIIRQAEIDAVEKRYAPYFQKQTGNVESK